MPDVLTALQLEWTQTVANGGTVPVVAVDIAGAFDRVSHSGIVHKIQQAGATGFLIAWLRDYVADRHLQVAMGGGKISTQHSIRAGVPRSSVLGPTLFSAVCCRHRQMPGLRQSAQLLR